MLDKMVAAMGYARDDVYICNVVKCRPPENRTPKADEAIAFCARLLEDLEDLYWMHQGMAEYRAGGGIDLETVAPLCDKYRST